MSKSKVRITPNPAANTKVNETGQTAVNKQRAAVSGVKSKPQQVQMEMLFNKNNLIWMGSGILLVAIGLVLMSGGKMPSPDVWDETIIYSPVRMVIAPIFILAGLIIEVFAIFRK
ncbi:MAG: DUF3098 domain-containing protein [Saprospiraceae bacterium]|nr:DUF3098 domain-containing protein [Saprospiraceae bacterium]